MADPVQIVEIRQPKITVEGNVFGGNAIKVDGKTLVEVHYVYPWVDNATVADLTRRIVEMLEGETRESA
ncbi:hypothetical protein J7E70_07720 [Variovorax paradoxus]|nr:hypothetical protein [Variovorax paradoxus]MBT2300350.1 hypothetical protein [Variovorax paradoxus]